MARQLADVTPAAAPGTGRRDVTRKVLLVLGIVITLQALFSLCFVSAQQLLTPRNMPFGVAGPPSPVVAAVTSKVGLTPAAYPSQSAAMNAINQGRLYGAYVAGSSSDTLIVVPTKSFFARVEIEAAFLDAAHKLGRPVTVHTAKPLPSSDPVGGVVSLLLLPLLIGGYVAAVVVFKRTGGTAAAPWRALILTGYALVGALLTDLIAGLGIGAYSSSHFWPLLLCFWLVTTAVVLASAAIQALAGRAGTGLVLLLFIIVGGPAAGGLGTYMLPVYWRNIGVIFPPQNAITLIRNVLYFGGNDITTPLVVLFLYALAGVAVIWYVGRIRPARAAAAHARGEVAEARSAESPAADPPGRGRGMIALVVALGLAAFVQCLFATTYMSAEHAPKATDMPFGVTGSSPVLTAAEKSISLKVTRYPNESAAKTAIDQAQIWGALIPSGASNTLIVVPSVSDLAPLDLAVRFQDAAKSAGQKLTVQQYAPVPLAAKDPFGLVQGLMLIPLLIGGYVCSTLLMSATGRAAGRWRLATLAGFAILAGLVVDLVVCYWLQGFPSSKFWIVWPICSLIVAVTAIMAGVLQKLFGAIGTLLMMVFILQLGNPSAGGATGVPYLPAFWRDIGPYLPPRNAYILLHQAIYFNGHGTTQALTVLLVYLGVAGLVLALLDWFRSEAPVPADATEAAAMTVPIGATP
ncbi:MAG TPA: hypothetical protein VFW50_23910 [Streptosporangiaceae bacterium]|nr:hypothetical protein [Streptosporangiaceae bacterium]